MDSPLFEPVSLGQLTLQHRIVYAPLTRNRASAAGVPLPRVKDYYAQRSSAPGTLLITEATVIASCAGGFPNVPGIWTPEQIAAWKEVVDAVHTKGCYIYSQLWALGRTAVPEMLDAQGLPYVSASDVHHLERSRAPRPLTVDEIKEYARLFAVAADNAVNKAGFDGVEIHGANGYLLDQFLQDVTNHRTDEYGDSPENRSRFHLEVIDSVSRAVGIERTAMRLSPWDRYNFMRNDTTLKSQFSCTVSMIKERFPKISYIHVTEPRIDGLDIKDVKECEGESNDFIRDIWSPLPLITCGAYTKETAGQAAKKGDIIASGRAFLANPDLVRRWKEDLPLNKYDRSTFYSLGDESEKGYTDYPFYA